MSQPVIESSETVIAPKDVETQDPAGIGPPLSVRSFGLTDTGKVRPSNQDHFLIADLRKCVRVVRTSLPVPKVQHGGDRGYLFVVADGMGGHAGGEQASALAVDSVETFVLDTFKWFARFKGKEEERVLADFQSALGGANARVRAEAAESPELHGMGTTLTLAFSLNDRLFVAHVGDTRCYLHRGSVLHRLTRDHTLVEEMVRRGALTAEEAAHHAWRHVVTNAVGGDSPEVRVEVHKIHLEAGDAVLLCSDGLTNLIGDEEIGQILQAEPDPEPACRKLVARALEEGGKDNVTVVVARFDAEGAAAT
jgi:protein phosphatase